VGISERFHIFQFKTLELSLSPTSKALEKRGGNLRPSTSTLSSTGRRHSDDLKAGIKINIIYQALSNNAENQKIMRC
jgi:hypothetical protein